MIQAIISAVPYRIGNINIKLTHVYLCLRFLPESFESPGRDRYGAVSIAQSLNDARNKDLRGTYKSAIYLYCEILPTK